MAIHRSLLEVAGAIADLTPIDWEALDAGAGTPLERASLARLRLLERVVRACGDVVRAGDSSDALGPADDAVPVSWGPFTLHERLGRGTFGSVYRAHDRRLDRIVALKLLQLRRDGHDVADSEVIDEGRLLAKVRHPNVVTVYGAERIDGRVGVWMEFVDGRTLEEELRQAGPLGIDEVASLGRALCSALAAVHDAGLLHRDLKAQNVMRARDGRILLTDFGAGLAVSTGEGVEPRTELAGTPLYLAPEVLAGHPASVSSEIYSLGVLLYHLATASFPVRGRTLGELRKAHKNGQRVSILAYRDRLPKAFMMVIDRAVDPDPTARFRSVGEFDAALRRASAGRPWARRWLPVPLLGSLGLVTALLWTYSRPPALWLTAPRPLPRDESAHALSVLFAKGSLFYYQLGNGIFESTGLSARQVGTLPGFDFIDINPQRSEYLALRWSVPNEEAQLWIVPIPTGLPRQVGNVRCGSAAWSSSGRQLAFVSGGALFVADGDGRSARRLPTPGQGFVKQPRWSPNDDVIRFDVYVGNPEIRTKSIWEVRVDGTGLRPLLAGWNSPPYECCGRWTPDGAYYVFQSMQEGRIDLWALPERRPWFPWKQSAPIQLTRGPMSFDTTIAVSGDGTTVYGVGTESKGELVRLNRQTGNFDPYLGGLSATWLTSSPDGRSIAYISYPDKKLWRARADGSDPTPLVVSPVEVDGAQWSPDSQWISFIGRLDGEHRRIFLVPATGGPTQAITREDVEQGIPTWSKDGTRLAFGDVPQTPGQPSGTGGLHIYDVRNRQLSDVSGSVGLWTCRWSPDGRYLAAVTISDPGMLEVFDLLTKKWRPLPASKHVNDPTWSQDSKFISYETESGPLVLRRVRVLDGRDVEVKRLDGYSVPSINVGWSGLAPDDSPLILHDLGKVEIYAIKLEHR